MDIIQANVTFSPEELTFIRQTIDLATISAKDAKFVANVQIKIDNELLQIHEIQNQTEIEKRRQLEEIKNGRKK